MANSTSEASLKIGQAAFDLALLGLGVVAGELTQVGEEVAAQRNVLGGVHDRLAGGRAEQVVRREHEQAGFHLSFDGKRDVHSHLVTVEVGVVGRTNEGMHADGLTFDELRLEGLDGKTVERRSAVEEDG
jgi:hypothetical protein